MQLVVRMSDSLVERLDALAAERGVTRSRVVRDLLAVGLGEAPERPAQLPTREELLDVLADRARGGNVAAARELLARQEAEMDPQERAWALFREMAKERRQ
jgi:predicted transcriptional regulator